MVSLLTHYDRYERHKTVELLLEKARGWSVLDLGGLSGFLADYVPDARVLALNVDETGDVRYTGARIPFRTAAFDAVASLDTFEHLPRALREPMLKECVRVSRRALLIAAPYGSPGHIAYEAKLDELHRELRGTYHRWLHEHVVRGLPTESDLEAWRGLLTQLGFSVQIWYAGDYRWQCGELEWILTQCGRHPALCEWVTRVSNFRSMALWHRIALKQTPDPNTNRFYLRATRK